MNNKPKTRLQEPERQANSFATFRLQAAYIRRCHGGDEPKMRSVEAYATERAQLHDFAAPAPGIPYLIETAARSVDRMSKRLQEELNSHMRRAMHWTGGPEPTVELALAEARLMIGELGRAALLLRFMGEGES